jgi:transposase-like protein
MDSQTTATEPIQRRFRQHYPLADRIRIEREYIQGQGSLSRLARKHSIPEPTLRRWADEDKWTRKRAVWTEKELNKTLKELETDTATATAPTQQQAEKDGTDQNQTITGQIKQIDLAILACHDPSVLVKLCEAKAKLYVLIHSKPAPSRPARRRPEPVSPLQPRPVLDPVPALGSTLQEPELEQSTAPTPQGTGPIRPG